VVVIDSLRHELEAAGHEVFIFAPDGSVNPRATKIRGKIAAKVGDKIREKSPKILREKIPTSEQISRKIMTDDDHIIRLPAVQYDMQLAVFFPPAVMKKIREKKLDVIQFFTPGQIGLMAAYAARKTGAVLVAQHSTDAYEFSKDYPSIILGCFFGGFLAPIVRKMSAREQMNFAKIYLSPRRFESDEKWGQRLVAGFTSVLYAGCDGVVAVSRKSSDQLQKFAERMNEKLNLKVIPTGVNVIKKPIDFAKKLTVFRKKFGITDDDEIILNFGRMAEEKNLPLLISALEQLVKTRPRAKLIFAGDYIFREKLEQIARKSPVSDRIIFVGRYNRADLPVICAAAKIFAFPSLTDTQALVLNEAASQNLPIVMIDQSGVNDVFRENENGFFAKNNAKNFAKKCADILSDDKLRTKFAQKSGEFAAEFSEESQTEKLVDFWRELLKLPVK
jgi:glycosyltransferase involved in cell wall biosynthesis